MSQHSQFTLLIEKRFGNFFAAQLIGAFLDNLFKNFLVLMVTYQAAQWTTLSPGLLTNLAAGLFILPFVLLSATAGQLADRYDKTVVIQIVKAVEIVIMATVGLGFYLHSLPILLFVLFLLGCHSAVFGPAKYSLLPRVLTERELTGGNGLVEMGTFIAILGGTIAAGVLTSNGTSGVALSAGMTLLAVIGFAFSMRMPRTGCAAPDLKVDFTLFRPTLQVLRDGKESKAVWLSLLAISWFWFFGALILSQLPALGKVSLHGSESLVTWLLAVFSVGVALGSIMCEKLSGPRVEIGLVPFGSIGLSLFATDLYFASSGYMAGSGMPLRVLFDLFCVGVSGGLYIVPLYALIQVRADKAKQSRIIAANNVLNAAFMVGSAGTAAALLAVGVSVPGLLLAGALLNAVVAAYIYTVVPQFLWRFVGWIAASTIYRVKTTDIDRIPLRGPALLVSNHTSFADAIVLAAAIPRPVRFVMDRAIFEAPVLKWLFRAAKAIPIASRHTHPEVCAHAYVEIDKALADGELVLIFPEGRLSPDGELGPFKAGYLKILAARQVPLIPIAVGGLWSSVFSRKPGARSASGLLHEFRHPVSVNVGQELSGAAPPAQEALREDVRQMLNVR